MPCSVKSCCEIGKHNSGPCFLPKSHPWCPVSAVWPGLQSYSRVKSLLLPAGAVSWWLVRHERRWGRLLWQERSPAGASVWTGDVSMLLCVFFQLTYCVGHKDTKIWTETKKPMTIVVDVTPGVLAQDISSDCRIQATLTLKSPSISLSL